MGEEHNPGRATGLSPLLVVVSVCLVDAGGCSGAAVSIKDALPD